MWHEMARRPWKNAVLARRAGAARRILLRLIAGVASGLTVCSAAPCQAEFPRPAQGQFRSYHHASTAQEGQLRGQADMVRAQGERVYNAAAAAYLREQARQINIRNELSHAEAFWAKRRIHDAYLAAEKSAGSSSAR